MYSKNNTPWNKMQISIGTTRHNQLTYYAQMGMQYSVYVMCTVKAILVTFIVLQGIAYIRGPPVKTSIKSIATYQATWNYMKTTKGGLISVSFSLWHKSLKKEPNHSPKQNPLRKKMFRIKVALSQKILDNFYFIEINIPNHYPEQKSLF